jgi:ferredoxin--NADP+ reductase/benzoate/toluate 1,2-dioxygenase reductase subunit
MIKKMTETLSKPVKVKQVRQITETAYVLRFDRNGRQFKAGQHVILGIKNENNAREYSVYSGENDDYFEVLIKEVLDGDVSKRLKKLRPGSELQMDGPMGFFTMENNIIDNNKVMLIATGTGIAPFRSFVRSYPSLDYHVLHGVRYGNETYDKDEYDPEKFTLCTSGDNSGDYHGRVTDFLRKSDLDKSTQYFLCGNVKMIHEAFDILKEKGIPEDNMHAEVYF